MYAENAVLLLVLCLQMKVSIQQCLNNYTSGNFCQQLFRQDVEACTFSSFLHSSYKSRCKEKRQGNLWTLYNTCSLKSWTVSESISMALYTFSSSLRTQTVVTEGVRTFIVTVQIGPTTLGSFYYLSFCAQYCMLMWYCKISTHRACQESWQASWLEPPLLGGQGPPGENNKCISEANTKM